MGGKQSPVTSILDTFLLAEDIAGEAQLQCLSCRAPLGQIRFMDQYDERGHAEKRISLSLLTQSLRDFKGEGRRLEIGCDCGALSRFHLI